MLLVSIKLRICKFSSYLNFIQNIFGTINFIEFSLYRGNIRTKIKRNLYRD